MTELKNSSLLERLVAYAKAVGEGKSTSLTAEKYLVAILDMIDGVFPLSEGESAGLAKDMIAEAGIDPVQSRKILLAYINKEKGPFFLTDDLHMMKLRTAAMEKARALELEELTAEQLLRFVLENPSNTIRECLNVRKRPVEQKDIEARLRKDVEDIFGQPMETPETEPVADTEEAPEAAPDARQKVAELTERVKGINAALSNVVFGQDNAVSVFASGYFQAELLSMTDKNRVRPRATYLFAGPPGVGKTFLAESAAKILGLPFKRFDMSEYCNKEASVEFCGSDKVYKNGKAGNFTSFVQENPKSVVLFDEIEKAHITIIHQFLQILDAGRIRDNYTDVEIALKDVIMIFTTNAGKQLYEQSDSGDFSLVSRKVILKALQKDINPVTGEPYFPAAICSRFASGNVVMFNHISAHNLRDIAKREVLRHAQNFQREIGVQVELDEKVFTALLFAQGGAADARSVRSRAEAFFDDELFELFRLIGSDASASGIAEVEKIRINVELPKNDSKILSLFESGEDPTVLVFSSKETAALCASQAADCDFVHAGTVTQADKLLRTRDVKVILLDLNYGLRGSRKYLNIEDVDSPSRDFFRHVRQMYGAIPVYLIQTPGHSFDPQEKISFLRQGVRGVLDVSGKGKAFAGALSRICGNLHQQQSMTELARANKLVIFETAQRLTKKGREAEIRLFDFKLVVAMDPEDSENILSNVSKPDVKFDQVIGAEDAKAELRYFVEYLKNPKKYLGTGVSAPKGVLLYGPPGTGKTMLAKAMASESDVTFITAEGNQFLKQFVGEGPQKVHELFRTARKYAPSIVFVDEIDAIAKERTGGENKGVEETLTAFLTEMDGFKNDPSKPVFVLAATNFEVEPGQAKSLDPALMRRFDRRVYIDLPNRDDRIRYMKLKTSGNAAYEISDEKLDNLAVRSTGMSLAQLESVFELSLRSAIREGNLRVTDAVLEEAFETFNSGEKKNWDISQIARVARHEAGHAFLCWHSGETPSYVTVVARADHGGYMQHGDHEGKALYTKDELLARIRTSLGGRAAEIVFYGPQDGISTGASGDLASATAVAQRIVCAYGMDDDFGLAVVDHQAASVGGISSTVRTAVNRILSEQMSKAVELIQANREAVERLVKALLERNHLTGNEIREIFENASCGDADK